jgi:hypothetical protein
MIRPERPTPPKWLDVQLTATGAAAPLGASSSPAPRPVSGRLVVLAVSLAALALAVAVASLVVRSRTVTTTTHIAAVVPLGVDAAGCPLGRSCWVSFEAEPAVLVAVDRALDFPTVIGAATVSDMPTGVTYRTTLTAVVNDGVTVTTTAQCLPGGSAVPPRSARLPATGPADGAIVIPGAPGCSVAVAVRAPAGAPVPVQAVEELGHDASAQLSGRR